eukprot:TRINITY_DN11497_c0_g1_i10.p3 TRINITY_DN11497_c0_g1~~TRINITY_DN11497_c0_g1_i10.p3  ORF type:complete len:230 (+),score=46.36 TRINITY_DN11497_c0_g1_i10:1285-1974(+)
MPDSTCAVVTGFWVRAIAYLIVSVAAATAAATIMLSQKQYKKIIEDEGAADDDVSYCPFLLNKKQDLIHEDGGHCDYIEFASIASAVLALSMLIVTTVYIAKGKMSPSKRVYMEAAIATVCLLVLGTAAILTTLGQNNFCKTAEKNAGIEMDCDAFFNSNDDTKKLYKYMTVCRDSTWAMAAGWFLLVVVLVWRSCAIRTGASGSGSYEFDNPNAGPGPKGGDMFGQVA